MQDAKSKPVNGKPINGKPVKKDGDELLDREQPHDSKAEEGLIGSCMLLFETIDDLSFIKPEFFYVQANGVLWRHLLAMRNDGKQQHFDSLIFIQRLKSENDYAAVGGAVEIARIINCVPHAAHAMYYAEIVRDKYLLRAMIAAGTDMLKEAYDDSNDVRQVIETHEAKVFDLMETGVAAVSKELASHDFVMQTLQRLEDRANGTVANGMKTGWGPFDDKLGGLHRGELVILAGRPGEGKTSMGLAIAASAAINQGAKVLMFSLEMPTLDLGDRLLSMLSRTNLWKMREGFLSQEQRQKITECSSYLSHSHFWIDDEPAPTVMQMAAQARRRKRQTGLDLIVIDYLQYVEPDDHKAPRQEQVAKISRGLKKMARRLDVTVLCLAQLNRNSENGNRRPKMSDLRESGQIEQDADSILFSHRPARYDENYAAKGPHEHERALMIVEKQRNGPAGVEVELLFDKECTLFLPAAPEHYNPGPTGAEWQPPQAQQGLIPLGDNF